MADLERRGIISGNTLYSAVRRLRLIEEQIATTTNRMGPRDGHVSGVAAHETQNTLLTLCTEAEGIMAARAAAGRDQYDPEFIGENTALRGPLDAALEPAHDVSYAHFNHMLDLRGGLAWVVAQLPQA